LLFVVSFREMVDLAFQLASRKTFSTVHASLYLI